MMNEYELVNSNEDQDHDICSICLENNDNTSIKLNCNCKYKYHRNCVKLMITHKKITCPICKKKIVETDNFDKVPFCVKLFATVFSVIFIFSFYSNCIVFPFSLPKVLNYCDNNYKLCDYYKTTGLIINNTINENINNFNIKLSLINTYLYDDNRICTAYDNNIFTSYYDIEMLAKKTIGKTNDIFVSYNNSEYCLNQYKWYNPYLFELYTIKLLNLISFIILLPSVGIFNLSQTSNNFLIKFIVHLQFTIVMFIILILSIIYFYYLLFL